MLTLKAWLLKLAQCWHSTCYPESNTHVGSSRWVPLCSPGSDGLLQLLRPSLSFPHLLTPPLSLAAPGRSPVRQHAQQDHSQGAHCLCSRPGHHLVPRGKTQTLLVILLSLFCCNCWLVLLLTGSGLCRATSSTLFCFMAIMAGTGRLGKLDTGCRLPTSLLEWLCLPTASSSF